MFHCQHLVSRPKPFIKHLFQSDRTCFRTEITPAAHFGLFSPLYWDKTFSESVGWQPRLPTATTQSLIFLMGSKWSENGHQPTFIQSESRPRKQLCWKVGLPPSQHFLVWILNSCRCHPPLWCVNIIKHLLSLGFLSPLTDYHFGRVVW